jgi:hypothetical protein
MRLGLKKAISGILRRDINQTENRAVLHTLRAKKSAVINVNGQNVVLIYDVKRERKRLNGGKNGIYWKLLLIL